MTFLIAGVIAVAETINPTADHSERMLEHKILVKWKLLETATVAIVGDYTS